MTLQEIFVDSPELIKHPEVKNLIAYCSNVHHDLREKWQALRDNETKILSTCFGSDVFVIDGQPATGAIKEIISVLE